MSVLAPGRARSRSVALLLDDEGMRCPRGHRVARHAWAIGPDTAIALRCLFRPPPDRFPCGACFVVLGDRAGARMVVEVSSVEAHRLESERVTREQIPAFLGLTLAGRR